MCVDDNKTPRLTVTQPAVAGTQPPAAGTGAGAGGTGAPPPAVGSGDIARGAGPEQQAMQPTGGAGGPMTIQAAPAGNTQQSSPLPDFLKLQTDWTSTPAPPTLDQLQSYLSSFSAPSIKQSQEKPQQPPPTPPRPETIHSPPRPETIHSPPRPRSLQPEITIQSHQPPEVATEDAVTQISEAARTTSGGNRLELFKTLAELTFPKASPDDRKAIALRASHSDFQELSPAEAIWRVGVALVRHRTAYDDLMDRNRDTKGHVSDEMRDVIRDHVADDVRTKLKQWNSTRPMGMNTLASIDNVRLRSDRPAPATMLNPDFKPASAKEINTEKLLQAEADRSATENLVLSDSIWDDPRKAKENISTYITLIKDHLTSIRQMVYAYSEIQEGLVDPEVKAEIESDLATLTKLDIEISRTLHRATIVLDQGHALSRPGKQEEGARKELTEVIADFNKIKVGKESMSGKFLLPEPATSIINAGEKPSTTPATNAAAGKTEPRYLGRLEENLNRQEPEKKEQKKGGGSTARSGDAMPRAVNEPHRGPAGGRRRGPGPGKGGRAPTPRWGDGGADFAGTPAKPRKKGVQTQPSSGQAFFPVTPEEKEAMAAEKEAFAAEKAAANAERKQRAAEKRAADEEKLKQDRQARAAREAEANRKRAEFDKKRKADAEKLKLEKQQAQKATNIQNNIVYILKGLNTGFPTVSVNKELSNQFSATGGDIDKIYEIIESRFGLAAVRSAKYPEGSIASVFLASVWSQLGQSQRLKGKDFDGKYGLRASQVSDIAINTYLAMIIQSPVIQQFLNNDIESAPSKNVYSAVVRELNRIYDAKWALENSLMNGLMFD